MLLGQSAGYVAENRIAAWRGSDKPIAAGNAFGVGVMLLLWLLLPEDAVAVISHVALAVLGAAVGSFFVLLVECERRKHQLQEDGCVRPFGHCV